MTGTIQWDTTSDSQLEAMQASGQLLRGGLVYNITLSGAETSADVLFGVLAIIRVSGVEFGTAHPAASTYAFTRARLLGMPDSDNCVRVQAIYETFQGGVNSAYILTRRTKNVLTQSNFHPSTRVPIKLAYRDQIPTGTPPAKLLIPPDLVTFSISMPCRAVVIDEVIYGDIDETRGDYVGYVNDAAWQGRGIGHWKFEDYVSTYIRYAGYYTRHSEVLTAGPIANWSAFAVLRSTMTGKAAGAGAIMDAKQAELVARNYLYGVDYPTPTNGAGYETGLARMGPYPLTSFFSLFGFN